MMEIKITPRKPDEVGGYLAGIDRSRRRQGR